jgi:putative FmdB family regulatory protein
VPTYDYVCEACGHALEHFQSMSEKRLVKCPKCGKRRLVRKVGAGGGVIFKGSGFYQTDYKKTSAPVGETTSGTKTETATSSKSESKSGDAKGTSKPESKPASAPPTSSGGAEKAGGRRKTTPGTCASGDSSS